MQATIPQFGLKSFTKALACLAKYGDELTFTATPTDFSLSATNSSKSAYGRVKFYSGFFEKYSLKVSNTSTPTDAMEEDTNMVPQVRGDILAKSALAVLRHRSVQDTVNKCDIMIVEGDADAGEGKDSLESLFVIRLHCKHGVVKTHRLSMNDPSPDLAPRIPSTDPSSQSRIVVGPRAVKDLLDHFSGLRKTDAHLDWEFANVSVKVKSLESTGKGRDSYIATEITVDAEEFDIYSVADPPTSMGFHLREFSATTALAESMSLPLNVLFTRPGHPLWIEVRADEEEAIFAIATSSSTSAVGTIDPGKRKRPPTVAGDLGTAKRRPTSRAPSAPRTASPRAAGPSRTSATDGYTNAVAGPSHIPEPLVQPEYQNNDETTIDMSFSPSHINDQQLPAFLSQQSNPPPNKLRSGHSTSPRARNQQPLFLEPSQQSLSLSQRPLSPGDDRPPPLSQLPASAAAMIRESGLGIEDMNPDEFDALMDDEGEDVDPGPIQQESTHEKWDSEEEAKPATQFPAPSQNPRSAMRNGRAFQAFFD